MASVILMKTQKIEDSTLIVGASVSYQSLWIS